MLVLGLTLIINVHNLSGNQALMIVTMHIPSQVYQELDSFE